jgi:hypothetical protein
MHSIPADEVGVGVGLDDFVPILVRMLAAACAGSCGVIHRDVDGKISPPA